MKRRLKELSSHGVTKSELNMEQHVVDMLSRQGRILWVDFNDLGQQKKKKLFLWQK